MPAFEGAKGFLEGRRSRTVIAVFKGAAGTRSGRPAVTATVLGSTLGLMAGMVCPT